MECAAAQIKHILIMGNM